MASKLKVDEFEGVTTAGSIDVTGEGGSTTTNLQQGLAKAWVNYTSNTTTSIRDSLNTASLTDISTGKTTVSLSNAMANASYSCPTACSNGDASGTANNLDPHNFLAGSTKFNSFANTGLADRDFNGVSFLGDLA